MAYSYAYTGVGDPSTVRRSDDIEFPQDPTSRYYGEWQAWIAGGGVTTPAPDPTLSDYKDNVKGTVNKMAADARRTFSRRPIPEDLGNLLRFTEAQDFDVEEGAGDYPLLDAEIPDNGADTEAVHDVVLAELATLKLDLANVEHLRLDAFDDIDACSTKAEVDAVLAALSFTARHLTPDAAVLQLVAQDPTLDGPTVAPAERGVSVHYDTDPSSYVEFQGSGGDTIDLATTSFTLCGWFKPQGSANGNRGQIPFSVSDGGGAEVMFADESFSGTSPLDMTSVDFSGAAERVGSWAPAWGEEWFFAMVWDHITATWTFYAAEDGAVALSSAAGSAGRDPFVLERIRILAQNFGDYGTNASATFVIADNVAHSAVELLAQMKSNIVLFASPWAVYELVDAADLADTSGNGRDLTSTGTVTDGDMAPADLA